MDNETRQAVGRTPEGAKSRASAGRRSANSRTPSQGPKVTRSAAASVKRRSSPSNSQARSNAPPEGARADTPAQGTADGRSPETARYATPSPEFICGELVKLQKRRRFCIRVQSQIDRALEAALAREIGYRTDLPKAEGKALFRRVAAMREATIVDDQLAGLPPEDRVVAATWRDLILQTHASRSGWDFEREATEAAMRDFAQRLPIWEWAAPIRGFGALALAILIGEACGYAAPTPAHFRSHQNLCKRLGLGVVDGHRQGSPGERPSKEDWTREGYDCTRRAEIWVILDYSLRMAQWRIEAGPQGTYGAIYARQVAEYEGRGWPHAKKAAARYMAKALIRDLWRAWRRYEPLGASITRAPDPGLINGDAPIPADEADAAPPQGQKKCAVGGAADMGAAA